MSRLYNITYDRFRLNKSIVPPGFVGIGYVRQAESCSRRGSSSAESEAGGRFFVTTCLKSLRHQQTPGYHVVARIEPIEVEPGRKAGSVEIERVDAG